LAIVFILCSQTSSGSVGDFDQWVEIQSLKFSSDPDDQKYIQYEFDEILKSERTDSFFTIYKLFTLINLEDSNVICQHQKVNRSKKENVLSERQQVL
jgi:hypothetical protein